MRDYTISLASTMRGSEAEFKMLIAKLFAREQKTSLFKFITKVQASTEMEKFLINLNFESLVLILLSTFITRQHVVIT